MKKLKLNLDDLQVESFETVSAKGKTHKGTVMGYVPVFTEEDCTFLQQETCDETEGNNTCDNGWCDSYVGAGETCGVFTYCC